MNALIRDLRQQHKDILDMIARGDDILSIVEFVEKVHHPLEEIELFPAVAANPLLREGGPLCTYFRSIDLELGPKEAPLQHLEDLYSKGFPRPSAYPSYDWFNAQSPLSIPMDEHVLGHALASALHGLAENKNSALYAEFYQKLSDDYISLLKLHINKEDNCLFIMCERMVR